MFFSFGYNPYIAVIGDIKNSRKIGNRDGVQEKLKKVLLDINKKYSNDIASKFTITLGDEFQGLLHDGENVMDIISEIERKMYPIKIRFGIGIGEITTVIDSERAIGADGPGYYKAREAIEFLKQNEKKKQSGKPDTRIESDGEKQGTVELLNAILSLTTAVKRSWSDRQRQTVWDMLEHRDSQSDAAERLGIKQSSVQKNLANGNYYTYKEAMDTVKKTLSEIRRKNV